MTGSPDDVPVPLQVMRAITGLTETPGDPDNPKILAMRDFIARTFPDQAGYCALYQHDETPWCGLTVAFCMAVAGIPGPFGPTDTDKWMWALSWAADPGYKHLAAPVLGCIVVMEREGGGHVTMFEGWDGADYIKCRGGNQSDAVNVQSYSVSGVVAYVWPALIPVPPTPPSERRELAEGDTGPDVAALQTTLGVFPADGDFGSITDGAVKGYQAACSIEADGVVGPTTWGKLDELDAKVAAGNDGLSPELVGAIADAARHSDIAGYSWDDRGRAPVGYIIGVALTFALALQHLNAEDDAAWEMAKADTGNSDKDALSWYMDEFDAEDMDNSQDGVDTLRHLFALMLGLGVRESSGRYCEGRDMSASNTSADEAEAGLCQTSWNIRSCSDLIPPMLPEYWNNPCGFREQFQEGVTLDSNDLGNYGSGAGAQYQFLSKFAPAFHLFVTAIGLRNLRQHWGPINRREVELLSESDEMLQEVQRLVEDGVDPPEPPAPDLPKVAITARGKVKVKTTGDVLVTLNGKPLETEDA
jgi:uncharacterized protein (TIGR02594 family)